MNKKVNCEDQVCYIRRYTLTEGRAAGIKIVEMYNGALRVLLNESKALDMLQLFHNGANISYLSKNAFTIRELDFMKRFEGGMIYTCGVDVIGATPGFENHGSFHNIPAEITRCECADGTLTVEADVRDTELFGKNLVMHRKYRTTLGSGEITLTDTLHNRGYRDEEYSILYHINVGYPMLDEGVKIVADVKDITPRNAWSKENVRGCFDVAPPTDVLPETCYTLALKTPHVEVVNKKLGKTLALDYAGPLEYFIEWKSEASGDYALGLEPSTSLLDDFKTSKIKKNEKIEFTVKLSVKDK